MIQEILTPLDGSSFSEYAVRYAGAIGRREKARLHLLMVHVPLLIPPAEIPAFQMADDWERERRQGESSYLERLARKLEQDGLEVRAELKEGEVAASIIERSRSETDLLVMATHGVGGVAGAWLGTVTDSVVHHVKLPILLVRPGEADETDVEPVIQHILVATDGSRAAEAATNHAVELARTFGARMTLLRVVVVPAGPASPYIPHAAMEDRETAERGEEVARQVLGELAVRIRQRGVEVETRVVRSYHTARSILAAAPELGCDLIALGTHRRARLSRIVLGSVADKVIRASPVPVLIGHAEA